MDINELLFNGQEPSVETAYTGSAGSPYAMRDERYNHRTLSTMMQEVANDQKAGSYTKAVGDWLPFAADKYKISADLKDYVVVPTVLVTSSLPNRNLVAFTFDDLTDFSTDMKMMRYKTWACSPTFTEHANDDVTKSKGVIFDVALRKAQGMPFWKVVALLGFDKTKDPVLANDIMTGRRNQYSMGAYVTGKYSCSICGFARKPQEKITCGHVDEKRRRLNVFPNRSGREEIAYWNLSGIVGFETSSVQVPAFVGAISNNLLLR